MSIIISINVTILHIEITIIFWSKKSIIKCEHLSLCQMLINNFAWVVCWLHDCCMCASSNEQLAFKLNPLIWIILNDENDLSFILYSHRSLAKFNRNWALLCLHEIFCVFLIILFLSHYIYFFELVYLMWHCVYVGTNCSLVFCICFFLLSSTSLFP